MPTMTRAPRTKCYLHEMQRPLDLPYEPYKYHICWVCKSRLLEIAKINFHFELSNQVVSISVQREVYKEPALEKLPAAVHLPEARAASDRRS